MNIKSLLLGSAAAAVAFTGAQAADAIIIAEPEPVEYVRICDVYGAGFFYIPGTQNCLKIGGYIRYQMNYNDADVFALSDPTDPTSPLVLVRDYTFTKFSRFQLNVDVRNETEWGTLRGYAEGRWDWDSLGGNSAYLNQGFIEIISGAGTIRLGKSDTPYARFLGYGAPLGPFDGAYAFNNSGELSYTYNGGNGFSAVVAVVERGTGEFEPAVEGGVNFAQGWGSIGAMAGYDTAAEEWGAKVVANGSFGAFSVGAHLFYASGPSIYSVDGGASDFSVLAYARADVSETLAVAGSVQWFDNDNIVADDEWWITGGLDWRPVSGLRIRPEVQYRVEAENWRAAIRFDRSF